ncbi:MAG: ABC transporter permease [Pedobacter sp.]|nr:ABC transporter permease [Pedobacter sp.]
MSTSVFAYVFTKGAIQKLKALRGLVVPAILLLLWQWQSGRSDVHAYAFTPLQNVANSFLELIENGELWVNLLGSLQRTSTGLLIGGIAGLLLGSAMALSKIVNTLVSPLYHSIRQVPLLGLVPLIGLWVGNGEPAKVFIISLAAFYPMVLNTYEGLHHVDDSYREVGRIYGFGKLRLFWRVQLPAALPSLFTGLTQAVPFAWITAVGSELLFNAGAGLGNLMMTAELGARMDIIIVCATAVTVLGVAMSYGVNALSDHVLRWRGAR